MAKASRSNRGSTKETEKMDWRTPVPLVRAIEKHFSCSFVLDAAATAENTLCPAFITKGMNTLTMPPERILKLFNDGHRYSIGKTDRQIITPAVWSNPEYRNSEELLLWIEKAAVFSNTYKIPWVFILPASRDEQEWFHTSIEWAAQYAYPKGRVNYFNPDGTPSNGGNHPSVVIAFNAPAAGPSQVTSLPNDWRKELPKAKRTKK